MSETFEIILGVGLIFFIILFVATFLFYEVGELIIIENHETKKNLHKLKIITVKCDWCGGTYGSDVTSGCPHCNAPVSYAEKESTNDKEREINKDRTILTKLFKGLTITTLMFAGCVGISNAFFTFAIERLKDFLNIESLLLSRGETVFALLMLAVFFTQLHYLIISMSYFCSAYDFVDNNCEIGS